MAAGDAHRVWFPEMVKHLRLRWRDDLTMAALLGLRDELDDMLGRTRSTRHIANPVFKCPACGHIGRCVDPHVSIRATILALASAWPRESRYRRLKRLDHLPKNGGP